MKTLRKFNPTNRIKHRIRYIESSPLNRRLTFKDREEYYKFFEEYYIKIFYLTALPS